MLGLLGTLVTHLQGKAELHAVNNLQLLQLNHFPLQVSKVEMKGATIHDYNYFPNICGGVVSWYRLDWQRVHKGIYPHDVVSGV